MSQCRYSIFVKVISSLLCYSLRYVRPFMGIFVALSVSAIFIALGVPLGPLLAVAVLFAFIFAFRYTYLSFYLALFFTPFLGFLVSIPTGELAFGKRAFGGSIDISVAEAILLIVLAVWAIKILLLWVKRHDINWRPKLSLVGSYAFLFAAHLLSAFSPLEPDPILTTKFALRPVLFCYLAYVALPVNLLRSRRRFLVALYTVVSVGTIAALNGAASLFCGSGKPISSTRASSSYFRHSSSRRQPQSSRGIIGGYSFCNSRARLSRKETAHQTIAFRISRASTHDRTSNFFAHCLDRVSFASRGIGVYRISADREEASVYDSRDNTFVYTAGRNNVEDRNFKCCGEQQFHSVRFD